jgi:hypothetical protein
VWWNKWLRSECVNGKRKGVKNEDEDGRKRVKEDVKWEEESGKKYWKNV